MNFFRKKQAKPPEPGLTEKVGRAIIQVASKTVESDESFRAEAKTAALALGKDSIDIFPSFFNNPPKMPPELNDYYGGLGHWLSVCQFAAFEMLFHFRENAFPLVRRIAFGEYDWIQGNAIEILCRWAAENIEREKIILELNDKMPEMRYEALIYAAEPLLKQAESNSAIQQILDELKAEEFKEVIQELTSEENS